MASSRIDPASFSAGTRKADLSPSVEGIHNMINPFFLNGTSEQLAEGNDGAGGGLQWFAISSNNWISSASIFV